MRAYKLLLLGVCALSVCALSPKGKTVKAVSKLETTLKEEVIYEEDFESYEIGADGEAVFQNEHFMWFNASHHDSEIKEINGSKAMEYSIIGDDGYGYSQLGGLGTNDSNNLEKLIDGEKYTISMDLTFTASDANSGFYINYMNADWIGIKITGGGEFIPQGNGGTQNPSYVQNHLEFSFIASQYSGYGTPVNSFMQFVGERCNIDDKVVIDNIKIVKPVSAPVVHSIDFENITLGTVSPAQNGDIYNIWNGQFDKIEIAGDENNHYLKATTSATAGNDAWPIFYLNNLNNLKTDVKYRLELDVLNANYKELYLGYNEGNGAPNAGYSLDSYLYTSNESVVLGGSFDGTHLTYDFIPSPNSVENPDYWAQVAFIVKHSEAVELSIDNIKIYELGKLGSSVSLDLTSVKTSYYVGEALDLSGLKASLVRQNESVRALNSDEYILDTTSINMNEAGLYQAKVRVVDEFGNLLTANIDIEVAADSVTSIAVTANPTKNIYAKGQELKLAGLEVTGTYASGRQAVIASENLTVSGYDKDTLGKQTLTVTYLEKTATFDVTVVESVKDAIVDVQTKAALAFDYKKTTNGLTDEVSYSDFKNFSIELFYELDLTAFVDVEEIGLCYVSGNHEFVSGNSLPEGAVTAKVADNAGSLTLTIENISDLTAIYSASVYVKTADGTYHYGKAISYSVSSMINEYAKISDAEYATIILDILGNLK